MASKLIPPLLALALLFSGCLGASDGEESLDPAGTGSNVTVDANASAGQPPTAWLEANRTEGPAPLSVSFALNGSRDNDNGTGALNWSLDTGDGVEPATGKRLPATVNHTYTKAGNYTALLTVTEGNLTGEANVTIRVQPVEADDGSGEDSDGDGEEGEAGQAKGTSGLPEPVVIEGSALVGHPAHTVFCFGGGFDGAMHEIAPAEAGWVYALEPESGFAVYWWSDDDFIEAGETTGTVPAGATRAEICATTGNAAASYTLTLWHPEHPDASGG